MAAAAAAAAAGDGGGGGGGDDDGGVARLLEVEELGKLAVTAADFAAAGLRSLAAVAALDATALCEKLGDGVKKAQARKILKCVVVRARNP